MSALSSHNYQEGSMPTPRERIAEPSWPYSLYWCPACGEPADNNATHDPEADPPGCGGDVVTILVMPVKVKRGTNGREWDVR